MSFTALLLSLFSCCGKGYTDLDVESFAAKIDEAGITLLDVRTAEEYSEKHIPGAANIDWYGEDFMEKTLAAYPTETPLAIYCRSGKRSTEAAKALSKEGYPVFNLLGGFNAWNEAGKRVTRYEVETFLTDSGVPVRITLVKHGSLEVAYKGVSIQVDPVSGLGKPTDYATEFPKADVILVTHEHQDHLDEEALKALEKEGTALFLNKAGANVIGRGKVISNGESAELPEGIRLEAVPAYNTTPGRERFHSKGNGNGYVLTMDGLRIYIAGDTEDIPEMAGLEDIDVAFLPVNQPYTMTVEQCAKAASAFKPKVLIPYHFSQTDISGLPAMLPGIEVRLRNMN